MAPTWKKADFIEPLAGGGYEFGGEGKLVEVLDALGQELRDDGISDLSPAILVAHILLHGDDFKAPGTQASPIPPAALARASICDRIRSG